MLSIESPAPESKGGAPTENRDAANAMRPTKAATDAYHDSAGMPRPRDEYDALFSDDLPDLSTPLAVARDYIRRGWAPVPIPFREKGPRLNGWGRLRLNGLTAPDHFSAAPANIGVILGDASRGLVDIDLDSPEARQLAPRFLPPTGAIFGRATSPRSHWLYACPGLHTQQIKAGPKTLLELRSNTETDQPSQTVFPGSTHRDTGEPIVWQGAGQEPAAVAQADLTKAFTRLGAAVALARAFPAEGGRNTATLALVGALVREGWPEAEVVKFVRAVRDAAGADPKKPLVKMAKAAAVQLAGDKKLFGIPTLRDHFGQRAADGVIDLLALGRRVDADTAFDEESDEWGDDEKPKPRRLEFFTPAECDDMPARGYVLKGLVAPGDVGCIFGAPGAGKSLLAPYLAYAVAQGRHAFGMRTKPGPVLYIAAEDLRGMMGRVRVLRQRFGDATDFLVGAVDDLLSKGSPDLKALLALVEETRPSLIVVDTLAAAFPGLEENSPDGMGQVVAVGRKLAALGAALVFIHHDRKDGAAMPRGHSIFNGALDFTLHLKPKDGDGIVRGAPVKNRNGTVDRDFAFRIGVEPMGVDEDGDSITFATCDELAPSEAPRRPKLSASERAAFGILVGMCELQGSLTVAEDEWRTRCIDGREVSASETSDSRRRSFVRAMQGLVRLRMVSVVEGRAAPLEANQAVADRIDSAFDDEPEEVQE